MALGILDLLALQQGGVTGKASSTYEPVDYPLDLPTVTGFRQFVTRQERAQRTSQSPTSFQSQIVQSSGERFIFEVTLPPMKRIKAAEWIGFLNLLDGKIGTFLLGDPLGRTPRGTPAGFPKVAAAGQTGKQLALYGANPNVTGWLKSGDWIQIGERAYMVNRDANSNSSGEVTLDIWPRLRESYDLDTAIVTANCRTLCRMREVSNDLFFVDETQFFSLSFIAEESL